MTKNLATELVTLFQGQKLETVQQAVKEATKQVWTELVTDPLNELFDNQMETLKARGCLQSVIDVLVSKKNEVIAKATEIETQDGHIPFITVVPRTEVDVENLIKMVRNRDREGYNYLNQSDLSNVVDVPNGPYFIFDVEDGKVMLGKSPEKAETLVKKQKRSCLTVEEGISLCIQTKVLSEHYVDCTGSRYKHSDVVPGVCLAGSGKPRLGWNSAGLSDDEWGSASCRSRA